MNREGIHALLWLVFVMGTGTADVPRLITYQGLLTDATGARVPDGNYSLTFKLYSTELGTHALWTETHPSVAVARGVITVVLGSTTPGGVSLTFDQQYWLGITVGGGSELVPRARLTSAPYSLNARTVSDNAITTGKLADDSVTAAKIQPALVSSINGVSHDGGNVDLVPQNAITLHADDVSNTVCIGETHSARTDNPHNTTAAQAGALVSVEGVSNPGGDINLVPGTNITINHDDSANNITISSNSWGLNGNAGTTPGLHFVGTRDNVPLELKVNGARALRLEPTATSINIIGGYYDNSITSDVDGGTIGGGGAYGSLNTVTDNFGTIGGGLGNQAGDDAGTSQDRNCATVGGGAGNKAIGYASTVSGGTANDATSQYSTVSGGYNNTASGDYSAVCGGSSNAAQGAYSFAGGRRAQALHDGCFVWGDSTNADILTSGANRFRVRASGGVWFYSNSGQTSGVRLPANESAWSTVSDREVKENITPISTRDILRKVTELSITRWNYKGQEPAIKHIGPMAQDFHAAFGLGDDEKSISTIDPDGVALASIQALHELMKEKDAKIADLEARVAALEKTLTP